MSIITVSNKPDERFGMTRAAKSFGYRIYKRDFEKGIIKIEFGGKVNFRFVMFYESFSRG